MSTELSLPTDPAGVVVIVRDPDHDGRCEHVAAMLGLRRMATLVVDAGTPDQLAAVLDRIGEDARVRGLPVGVLGIADGATTALAVAAARPTAITAVVACCPTSELPARDLERVRAATLFVAGSSDLWGQRVGRAMADRMLAIEHVIVVPGAGQAFEKPGALDEMIAFASRWFEENFRRGPTQRAAAR